MRCNDGLRRSASADDGETWTDYDKTGKLIESDEALTPKKVEAIAGNFKPVPSIMPDSLETQQ